MHSPSALHGLLPTADVVVLTAPQTAATRNLIGAAELALMKETAVIVNVSRGALIDEDALADALRRRVIGAAALDVFRDEPLDAGHRLWTVPNLLITPHSAGFRSDHWQAATKLFAENLRRFDQASLSSTLSTKALATEASCGLGTGQHSARASRRATKARRPREYSATVLRAFVSSCLREARSALVVTFQA